MARQAEDPIATLRISYQDEAEHMTWRTVAVTEFNPRYLFGHCSLRDSYRTFLCERIQSAVDVKTGESIANVNKYLWDVYCKTPVYALDMLVKNHRHALQIMLYVAKADGRMSADERKVMNAACKVFTGDVRLTEEMTSQVFRAMKIPSLATFKKACATVALRGNASFMRRLMIACQSIVTTESKIKEAEQEALDYIAKRFNLRPPSDT